MKTLLVTVSEEIDMTAVEVGEGVGEVFVDDHDSMETIEFAYCTEFLIQYLKPEVTEEAIDSFRRRLNRIGDCVLVVGDLSLVKVHVHTNNPGKALQYRYGANAEKGKRQDGKAEGQRASQGLWHGSRELGRWFLSDFP